MKRILSGVLAGTMLLSLMACGGDDSAAGGDAAGGDSGEVQVIKIATVLSGETSPGLQALELFETNFEAATEGRYDVQLFPGGQLGNQTDTIAQTRDGDIQMATTNPLEISQTITPLATLDQYYLFDDVEHVLRFTNGEGGQYLLDSFNQMGVQGVAFFPLGFRHLSNNKGPIETMDDLAGLKIRGYNPIQIAVWESVGCNLSSVTWNELFTAMQQNLIDGQETALTAFAEAKFYEVQEYMSLTSHLASYDILIANQAWLEAMPEADRAIFDAQMAISVEHQNAEFVKQTNELIDTLTTEHGMTISEVPADTLQAMKDQMFPISQAEILKVTDQETYDTVMGYVDAVRE